MKLKTKISIASAIIMLIYLCLAWVIVRAQEPVVTDPELTVPGDTVDLTQPQEAMSGLYSYRITESNILLIDSSECLLLDKFTQVEFLRPADKSRGIAAVTMKDWSLIKPRLAKMFEEIMAVEGTVDFAIGIGGYQFAVQIASRFGWLKAKDGEKSMLQETLAIVDTYIQ